MLDIRSEKTVEGEDEKINANSAQQSEDEAELEISLSGGRPGCFDRLGIIIDDTLHRIFTVYVRKRLRLSVIV